MHCPDSQAVPAGNSSRKLTVDSGNQPNGHSNPEPRARRFSNGPRNPPCRYSGSRARGQEDRRLPEQEIQATFSTAKAARNSDQEFLLLHRILNFTARLNSPVSFKQVFSTLLQDVQACRKFYLSQSARHDRSSEASPYR